jgi:hypothetical protein
LNALCWMKKEDDVSTGTSQSPSVNNNVNKQLH